MTEQNAKLYLPENKEPIILPIHQGSLGNKVVAVNGLLQQGYFTYDPGFMATAATQSAITFIDGERGVLLYRGYPIEQLAEKSDYMDTCYLLLFGELPNAAQREDFLHRIKYRTMVTEQMQIFIKGFRRDAHPMAIMCGLVGALSAFYHDSLNIKEQAHRELSAYRLIAKLPTIAAMSYKYAVEQPFIYPKNKLGYTENFLHMVFANPCEDYVVDPAIVKAMDLIFMLHADHEQNASTSTVRLAGSTGANPFACIAAGIAALWGPRHGGANEAVLNMLETIGTEANIHQYVARAKDKNDNFRLMGFGHRVYKNYDPRANVLKKHARKVLEVAGQHNSPVFDIALRLEEIAREDSYFIEKKLYPNVDFYSGLILKAIGIPKSMFTVIFALARTVGWIAHWNEMVGGSYKLGRPRQLYTGSEKRDML